MLKKTKDMKRSTDQSCLYCNQFNYFKLTIQNKI